MTQVDGPSAGATYPANAECQQAVNAANYAKTQGTLIYSISYGSEITGCTHSPWGHTQAVRHDAADVLLTLVAVFLLGPR